MKMIIGLVMLLSLFAGQVHAEYVHGYYRRDGTYVQPYYRTPKNDNPYDNQSYPGNYNYNTGRRTTERRDSYLNDDDRCADRVYSNPSYIKPTTRFEIDDLR